MTCGSSSAASGSAPTQVEARDFCFKLIRKPDHSGHGRTDDHRSDQMFSLAPNLDMSKALPVCCHQ